MIVAANAILRDTKRRVAYDRLLQLEDQRIQSVAAIAIRGDAEQRGAAYDRRPRFGRRLLRSKRTRSIISHIAVAAVSVGLTIGYEFVAPISTTAVVAKVKDIATAIAAATKVKDTATAIAAVKVDMAGGPAAIAAVQPAAQSNTAGQDEPRDKHEDVEVSDRVIEPSTATPPTNDDDARVVADHERAPDLLSNGAEFYREEGIISYHSGDFPRAIVELDEAIRRDPTDALAYNIRGNALDEIGAFERALADYAQAIRIDPNNSAVFHDRAILWHRKGALDKALVDLNRAIRFSSSDANLYSDRGLVWYAKGRYDRAIEDFNRAIKIDPDFANAYIDRGIILHRKSDLAFAAINQAIRVDPKIFDVNRRTTLRP
jgi:tetratricopeptide (TPR) repeat protein